MAVYSLTEKEKMLFDLLTNKYQRTIREAAGLVLPWLKDTESWEFSNKFPQRVVIEYEPGKRILEQADLVDSLCYGLALEVGNLDEDKLEWDIEFIGEIRCDILNYLEAKTGKPRHTWYV
jgi:hypothetical protein